VVQVKKAEKKEAILKSAYRLFKRKGYVATTTVQIAAGARVSESNVYAYFESKFDILFSLFEPWIRERIERLEIRVSSEPDSRAKLRVLLTALWREIPYDDNGFSNNMMQALSTLAGRDKYDPKLLQWVKQRIEAMILTAVPRKWHAELTKGDLGRVLVMAQDGFVMHVHLGRSSPCSEAMIELFCDLILGTKASVPHELPTALKREQVSVL